MTATIRRRVRSVPPLVWMVLIAFLLRLAVIPFDTIENLMDASPLHAWQQDNHNHCGAFSPCVPMVAGLTTTQHEEFPS